MIFRKPANMVEPCTKLVLVNDLYSPFEPVGGKAVFFIDDHGTRWVRFEVDEPTGIRIKVCVPLAQVYWIEQ